MTTVMMIQHLPHEHEGVLGEVLVERGIAIQRHRAWVDPIPADPGDVDALIVLGGDMNSDEEQEWPHLRDVRDLLATAVQADVTTLAICLGAQLLAEAGGGSVSHGVPEIGFIPITATPAGRTDPVVSAVPDGTPFFNAHADQITMPPDARLLACSADTTVHAFRLRQALGLQFHAEIDASFVASYVEAPGVAAYLCANGWTGEELVTAARRHNTAHRAAGAMVFNAWVDEVVHKHT